MNPTRFEAEIVLFTKEDGPLTKRIALDANGQLLSDGTACVMSRGSAQRIRIGGLDQLAKFIDGLDQHQAIALGALRVGLPVECRVVTDKELKRVNGTPTPDLIARTREHIHFGSRAGLLLVDFDRKGMPLAVGEQIVKLGGFERALFSVLPELARAGTISRASTSAGLFRTDTGERFPGSGGQHLYIQITDVADSARFLKVLHQRCWLAGLGWLMCGAAGQLLERSLVDYTVGSPERLVFEGPPVLGKLLAQDQQAREPVVREGEIINTVDAGPPLTIVERAKLNELLARERPRLEPEARKARNYFIEQHAAKLSKRTGIPIADAARIIARQCAGILLPDIVLPFDDEELAGATVADVLADPERYEGATLADPLEGPEYGACKAMVMRRADGTLWINSFAHGRTVYELRYDFVSIKGAIESAPANEVARTFVTLVLAGALDADEVEQLRDLAAARSGVGKRTLDQKLKNARQEQIQLRINENRQRRRAERQDPRPQIPAPEPDAEWLPRMAVINDVLGASTALEPPMRDIEGIAAEVRVRGIGIGRLLTAAGGNQEETNKTRLPPPEQPLLTRLSEAELGELIERHIEYIVETREGERAVHLAAPFVKHFWQRADGRLPTASGIATMPAVLADGTLYTGSGLDRQRGVVFRIPPELLTLLPTAADCSPPAVADAMRFLCDDWLIDVSASYPSKCVLVALALTIIERLVLAERPGFLVTAARRGGGKTTVVHMIATAVLGHRAPAVAWSNSEEERRKALFAFLASALPLIAWDNIARGVSISCPSIEKALTAETYADRILGLSEPRTVAASTIMVFTGNNIRARGDLASRTLESRLDVDRLDPENRAFHHPDPIAWTDANRGQILRALFTILLGNPRLSHKAAPPAQTRFKAWWHLVGSAVEHAANVCADQDHHFVGDPNPQCPAENVSFRKLFYDSEADEEQDNSLATCLSVIKDRWPQGCSAADISQFINGKIREPNGSWDNMIPDPAGAALKDALEAASGKTIKVTTPHIVTWRLKAIVDAPASVNGCLVALKYTPDYELGTYRVINVR